ncbi:tetratricopeptide repeat protein [Ignatzschineria larvae DSM 13226]|uniref:Tetratricopeptide repeat protein n=1 Tax=Ignatzschineria larvae DSM 13226 TaxID=1111732 RepID=A0ABZ3BXN6_9GAMM|nr:tetratricopeptide repeat protein [Ignatzschineria larvae]
MMMLMGYRGELLRGLMGSLLLLLMVGCASLSNDSQVPVTLAELSEAEQKHYELSLHYIDTAHYDAAEEKLQAILQQRPAFSEGYNAMGVLYERKGRVTKGSEYFLEAIKLDPNYDIAVINYSQLMCYKSGSDGISQAIELEVKAIVMIENRRKIESRLYTALLKCYIKEDYLQNGQQVAEKAIILDPDYALTYLYFADILYRQHNYMKAREAIDRFNDLHGYSRESAQLGLKISDALQHQDEINKYQYVLRTQFDEDL